jgi:tetratricopeptide (TPR) repeat protein
MKRLRIVLLATLVFSILLASACSERGEVSVLYVLEELEAASSIEDPEEMIDRLGIFINNHQDHRYRIMAYGRIFEAIATDLNDHDRALRYIEGVMERESDPAVRGMLEYRKFAYLWKKDREGATALAGELVEGPESYYRLFLYISYYLVWDEDYEQYEDLARRTLSKAIEVAANDAERNQASAILGGLERKLGNIERALEILEPLAGNYAADESIGDILWERGDREKALEAYVRLVAAVPGALEEKSIDSLYALVYPDGPGLEERIWEKRIVDSGELAPQSFVDIEGKRYDLEKLRGTKLVINIWQPT